MSDTYSPAGSGDEASDSPNDGDSVSSPGGSPVGTPRARRINLSESEDEEEEEDEKQSTHQRASSALNKHLLSSEDEEEDEFTPHQRSQPSPSPESDEDKDESPVPEEATAPVPADVATQRLPPEDAFPTVDSPQPSQVPPPPSQPPDYDDDDADSDREVPRARPDKEVPTSDEEEEEPQDGWRKPGLSLEAEQLDLVQPRAQPPLRYSDTAFHRDRLKYLKLCTSGASPTQNAVAVSVRAYPDPPVDVLRYGCAYYPEFSRFVTYRLRKTKQQDAVLVEFLVQPSTTKPAKNKLEWGPLTEEKKAGSTLRTFPVFEHKVTASAFFDKIREALRVSVSLKGEKSDSAYPSRLVGITCALDLTEVKDAADTELTLVRQFQGERAEQESTSIAGLRVALRECVHPQLLDGVVARLRIPRWDRHPDGPVLVKERDHTYRMYPWLFRSHAGNLDTQIAGTLVDLNPFHVLHVIEFPFGLLLLESRLADDAVWRLVTPCCSLELPLPADIASSSLLTRSGRRTKQQSACELLYRHHTDPRVFGLLLTNRSQVLEYCLSPGFLVGAALPTQITVHGKTHVVRSEITAKETHVAIELAEHTPAQTITAVYSRLQLLAIPLAGTCVLTPRCTTGITGAAYQIRVAVEHKDQTLMITNDTDERLESTANLPDLQMYSTVDQHVRHESKNGVTRTMGHVYGCLSADLLRTDTLLHRRADGPACKDAYLWDLERLRSGGSKESATKALLGQGGGSGGARDQGGAYTQLVYSPYTDLLHVSRAVSLSEGLAGTLATGGEEEEEKKRHVPRGVPPARPVSRAGSGSESVSASSKRSGESQQTAKEKSQAARKQQLLRRKQAAEEEAQQKKQQKEAERERRQAEAEAKRLANAQEAEKRREAAEISRKQELEKQQAENERKRLERQKADRERQLQKQQELYHKRVEKGHAEAVAKLQVRIAELEEELKACREALEEKTREVETLKKQHELDLAKLHSEHAEKHRLEREKQEQVHAERMNTLAMQHQLEQQVLKETHQKELEQLHARIAPPAPEAKQAPSTDVQKQQQQQAQPGGEHKHKEAPSESESSSEDSSEDEEEEEEEEEGKHAAPGHWLSGVCYFTVRDLQQVHSERDFETKEDLSKPLAYSWEFAQAYTHNRRATLARDGLVVPLKNADSAAAFMGSAARNALQPVLDRHTATVWRKGADAATQSWHGVQQKLTAWSSELVRAHNGDLGFVLRRTQVDPPVSVQDQHTHIEDRVQELFGRGGDNVLETAAEIEYKGLQPAATVTLPQTHVALAPYSKLLQQRVFSSCGVPRDVAEAIGQKPLMGLYFNTRPTVRALSVFGASATNRVLVFMLSVARALGLSMPFRLGANARAIREFARSVSPLSNFSVDFITSAVSRCSRSEMSEAEWYQSIVGSLKLYSGMEKEFPVLQGHEIRSAVSARLAPWTFTLTQNIFAAVLFVLGDVYLSPREHAYLSLNHFYLWDKDTCEAVGSCFSATDQAKLQFSAAFYTLRVFLDQLLYVDPGTCLALFARDLAAAGLAPFGSGEIERLSGLIVTDTARQRRGDGSHWKATWTQHSDVYDLVQGDNHTATFRVANFPEDKSLAPYALAQGALLTGHANLDQAELPQEVKRHEGVASTVTCGPGEIKVELAKVFAKHMTRYVATQLWAVTRNLVHQALVRSASSS